jgi:Tfp pilus assembly protein PilV
MFCLHRFRRRSGFTIAEVALSGFVLSTGMLVVMSLFSVAYRNTTESQKLIIASELAQEGVELVRNIRDNNLAYRTENWTTGSNCQASTAGACDPFNNFPTGNAKCTMSHGDTTLSCGAVNKSIGLDASGFYWHGAGVASGRFFRLIKIDHTGGADTARVQSFATWQDPGINLDGNGAAGWCKALNKCVFTELYLTSWK